MVMAQWEIINNRYKNLEGYKRVAWPPVSEERIIREFTPQPHAQSPAPGYYAQQQQQPQQTSQDQQQPQGPIYNNVHSQSYAKPEQRNVPNNQQQFSHQPNQYQQPQQQQQQYPTVAPTQNGHGHNVPIQYTQAHHNRYVDNAPPVQSAPSSVNFVPYQHQPQQQQQQPQQQYEPPRNQYPNQAAPHGSYESNPTFDAGWKPIRAPVPKLENQYHNEQYPQQHQDYYGQPRAGDVNYQQNAAQVQQPGNYVPQQQQQPFYQAPTNQYVAPQQHQQPQWNQQQQQQPQQQQQAYPYNAQFPSNLTSSAAPQTQPQPPSSTYQLPPQAQQYGQPTQYNNFCSQNQQQQQPPISRDQPDQRQISVEPQTYRGASPGVITLRKETPVTQAPAPVYISQPAAVSYQDSELGGSKLRGDLKWPPPEYKEAAARENEERRSLARGPVCRPRKVNRDYTAFFAKHALNMSYPSYKVPPGTQHMLA